MQNSHGNVPGVTLFATYVGPSMNPTLRELDVMEIKPYNRRPLRIGDVTFFLPPDSDQPIVHRINQMTPAGIATLGDNNNQEDAILLQPKDIKGQVVAAWRGQKRRKIAGGYQGWMINRCLRWRRVLDRIFSPLLYPFYRVLSHKRLITSLLPAAFRPRVVVFNVRGQDQFQLLLGKRKIGQYDDQRHQWQIQRPYRLFVDKRVLQSQQNKDRSTRQVLTEQQRPMNKLQAQEMLYNLILADGSHWQIGAVDEQAAFIVSQLGCAMQLNKATGINEPSEQNNLSRLLVQVEAHMSSADFRFPLVSENGVGVCILRPNKGRGGLYVNLVRLSLILAREAQARGGVLIHGALAERDGKGVILAAPAGTGKTTASNRIPSPWRSLSDDSTLIVRDPQGNYLAHPWPTWSRFIDGGPGGIWNVQSAVPVKGIFFLSQAAEDRVERVGPGHAVSLLVECTEQVSPIMTLNLSKEEARALRLERFNNICALARVVPAHMLQISLTGPFWQEIEQAL